MFFSLFIEEPYEEISILIFIFAIGWPMYIARSVLKVVSFYFGASVYQLRLQVVNFIMLIMLLGVCSIMLGYAGVAVSYVLSAVIASGIYLTLIRRSKD